MAELDTSKINEILNYYGLKTNIEETKKWVKKYVDDALTGITTDLMNSGTYEQIKGWRDNGELKPGMLYGMTDYVTKVYSEDGSVSSAEHPFDLILFANTTNRLNENAFAIQHEGDEYFSDSKLNAWEIKYSLDNDDMRFEFVDYENGKGVIYYMKDEFNNEAPFDFKNILQNDGEYTFGNNGEDYSLNGYANGIYNNKLLPCVNYETGKQTINKIRVTGEDCNTNIFKPTCVNSYIDFPISECDISMNDDGELVVFKTQDFVSGIENKPIEHNYKNDYLTFEAVNDNTEIIFKTYTDDSQYTKTIEVSKDKVNWETKTSSLEGVILASLNAGEKLYLRGNNSSYGYYYDDWDEYLPNFILPLNDCYVYGNIMSLIDSNNFRTLTEITDDYALYSLFYDYWNGEYSGEYVLNHQDKKLVLPATTLASSCYYSMFNGCTSLTTAPELPATTLVEGCYYYMFRNCTNLTTAPALPATTLASSCYYYMFNGCSSLNYIKCLAVNGINTNGSTSRWVSGVAGSGTFVKNHNATSWATGSDGIPTNWVVEDANIE